MPTSSLQSSGELDAAHTAGHTDDAHGSFSPTGAIAFFVLLILMYTAMWFSIYFELIDRI